MHNNQPATGVTRVPIRIEETVRGRGVKNRGRVLILGRHVRRILGEAAVNEGGPLLHTPYDPFLGKIQASMNRRVKVQPTDPEVDPN
jgi:hypothetical protein